MQTNIDKEIQQAQDRVLAFIEVIYITAKSRIAGMDYTNRSLLPETVESYLEKRGYVKNYVSGRKIFVKEFTCVEVKRSGGVEIWHDKVSSQPQLIHESILTGLPISLDYMERI